MELKKKEKKDKNKYKVGKLIYGSKKVKKLPELPPIIFSAPKDSRAGTLFIGVLAYANVTLNSDQKEEILFRETLMKSLGSVEPDVTLSKKKLKLKKKEDENPIDQKVSKSEDDILHLPRDILLLIFQNLDVADLFHVSLLSKLSAKIMKDDQIWNSYFVANKFSDRAVAVIQKFKYTIVRRCSIPFEIIFPYKQITGKEFLFNLQFLNAYEFESLPHLSSEGVTFLHCVDISRFDEEIDGENYLKRSLRIIGGHLKVHRDREAECDDGYGTMTVPTGIEEFKQKITDGVVFNQFFEDPLFTGKNDIQTILRHLESIFWDVGKELKPITKKVYVASSKKKELRESPFIKVWTVFVDTEDNSARWIASLLSSYWIGPMQFD